MRGPSWVVPGAEQYSSGAQPSWVKEYVETPTWAKPLPTQVSSQTPSWTKKPTFQVEYLKPEDTFDTIRQRMRDKTADPRYGTFLQGNIYRKPLEETPGFSGFYSAAMLDIPTRFDPEAFEKAKQAGPLAYAVGRGLGHMAKYGMGYGMIGPYIEGAKGFQAIKSPFLRTMAVEGAKDLVIGGSIGAAEGLIQGKKPGEIVKDMPKQLAQDVAANIVFYGAGKAIKGLKGKIPSWAKQQQVPEVDPSWAKSITMPDGTQFGGTDVAIKGTVPDSGLVKGITGTVPEPQPVFVDRIYDRQYNDINTIKAQLSKYYSGFDDYAHKEALDYAAGAIKDLQDTELNLSRTRRTLDTAGGLGRVQPGEWSGAGRTVGHGFSQNLIDTGRVNLTGIEFNNLDELATIAQVYRDPRFETFRLIYTKGNTIVGTEAVTSRLPSSSRPFVETKTTNALNNIRRRMNSFGADGYYLLHNHPAGSMKPSAADIHVTETIANRLPGFKNHIIINSNQYTKISATDIGDKLQLFGEEGLPLNLGTDRLWQASLPHPLLGTKLNSTDELAAIAKQIEASDNMSVAFFVSGGTGKVPRVSAIQGIMEVDNRFLNANPTEFANFLKNRSVDYGGAKVFLSLNGNYSLDNAISLVADGYVADAIDAKKMMPSLRSSGVTPTNASKGMWMGVDPSKAAWRVDAVKGHRTPVAIIKDEGKGLTGSPGPLTGQMAGSGVLSMDAPIRRSDIIKILDEQLDVPIRTGRFRQRALGIYKTQPEVIRLKSANDISTLAHEIGHHLDKKLKLFDVAFDNELMQLGKVTSRSSYTKAQIRAEGVAEFMRYYLMDPDSAKRLAPGYYNAFEQKIGSTGVKDILNGVRTQVEGYMSQSPVQRVLSQISTDKPPAQKVTLDKMYTMAFDDLQPLKRAVQDMTGRTDIPITKDPFSMAELHRGWVGKAEAYLHYGVVDESFNKVGKSLDEILQPITDRLDDFRAYSVAKRAVELSGRGIESGIALDDALATVKTLDSSQFSNTFKELVNYQDSVLKQLVDTGALSPDSMAAIRALNQNYVPFYRLFDEAGGSGMGRQAFANLPSPIKGIKGSGREIIDPIESIIKNTYAITNVGERNRVGRALIELAESTPGAGRWAEKVATPMFGNQFQLDDIAKALRDAGVDTSSIDLEHVATIFKPSLFAPGKENIVTVFRNGKREFWQLQPDLYRAMLTLDKESSNTLVKLLSFPAKILRAGATLNPEFMARNPIRDAFTAHVYSKYGFIPGIDTARGLFHVLKKDDLYWKWKAAGGSHGALVSLDRNYLQASIRSITERSMRDKTLNIIRNPIEGLRVLSEFTEEATRVAEFAKGLKKEGMTRSGILKAAASSRDVTLDFARAGTVSKEANKVIAFFNAALQGTDKMARQFRADPTGSTVRAVTSITLPSIALYYINHDNPKYQELPQWQKDFFWIIPVKDKFYRIPKPFELGIIFGTLPERMLEFAKTNDRKAFDEYGKNLLEAGAPSVVPTAMLPLVEAWANKSFFTELPIVPQSEERLPKPLQYGPYTSETAKALGRLMDISPRKIDNTIRGYSAGLGTYATKGLDLLLTGTGAVTPTPKPSTYEPDVPVAKAFQVRTFGQSKSVDEFYTELEKLEGLYSGVRKRFNVPAGTTIKLEELMGIARTKDIGMKPEDIERLIVFRKARTEFSDLRQLKANVERDNKLTTAEKRDISTRIDQRMTDIARMLMGKKPMGGNR